MHDGLFQRYPLTSRKDRQQNNNFPFILPISPWEGDDFYNSIKKEIKTKFKRSLTQKSASASKFYGGKNTIPHQKVDQQLIRMKTLQFLPEEKQIIPQYKQPLMHKVRGKLSYDVLPKKQKPLKLVNQRQYTQKLNKQEQVKKIMQEKKRSKRLQTIQNKDKNTLLFFLQARKKNNIMNRQKNIMKIRNIVQKKSRFKTDD